MSKLKMKDVLGWRADEKDYCFNCYCNDENADKDFKPIIDGRDIKTTNNNWEDDVIIICDECGEVLHMGGEMLSEY